MLPPATGAINAISNPDRRAGNEVHHVVEPRRRPAERRVALVTMADHRVRRVDRLVGEQAGQAEQREPQRGRDHAVGEILRARFDRRAADAGLVEALGIAADDHGDGAPRRRDAACSERGADACDMLIEAALGDEDGGNERDPHIARRQGPQQYVDQMTEIDGDGQNYEQRHDAGDPAPRERPALPIEPAIECRNADAERSPPDAEFGATGHPDRRSGHRARAPRPRSTAGRRRAARQRLTRSISAVRRSSASLSIGPPHTVSRSGMTRRLSGG